MRRTALLALFLTFLAPLALQAASIERNNYIPGIQLVENGAGAAGKETTTVIGRVKDLQNLAPGEKSLLDRLPNLGNPKANWKQNAGVLRQEMNKGLPILDKSPGDTTGQFLNAERNLLQSRGWKFDPETNFWNPPAAGGTR